MVLCSYGFVGSKRDSLLDQAKQIYDQDQIPTNYVKIYKGTFEENLPNILADMIITLEKSLNNLGMDVEYKYAGITVKPRTEGWSSVLPYTD
jgi:hypothetical protein